MAETTRAEGPGGLDGRGEEGVRVDVSDEREVTHRENAELLLRRARLLGSGDPVDVLVDGGVITRVAPRLDVGATRTVDLDGRTLIRGLRDEHVHFTQWTLAGRRLDLSGARSAAEVAALVAAQAAADGADEATVLVGVGFQDALWPDRPSAAALDASAGSRPVALLSHDLHCTWVNTAAAARFDVVLDESGLLREDPAFRVQQALDRQPDHVVDAWAVEAGRLAAAKGVVGVVDLEMTWNLDHWTRRVDAGFDALAVDFGVYPQHLEQAIDAGLRTGVELRPGLRVGPLKVLIDGSLGTRTAHCDHPYADGDGSGVATVSEADLRALLERCRDGGFVPVVHAIGDRAVRTALDAFEAVGVRGRIEHAQLIGDVDIPRFAALGVAASMQPAHLLDDRDIADAQWKGRTGRMFPLRALLDAGARLEFGSDAPVARLDPWLAMSAAVNRAVPGDEAWHPEQAITIAEALDASTGGRALPRIGDTADLAALDTDPLTADPLTLASTPVALTLRAGRTTHSAL